jgi:hypothetical protein
VGHDDAGTGGLPTLRRRRNLLVTAQRRRKLIRVLRRAVELGSLDRSCRLVRPGGERTHDPRSAQQQRSLKMAGGPPALTSKGEGCRWPTRH